MDAERRVALARKVQDLKLLKPKIRSLIRSIHQGVQSPEERRGQKRRSVGTYRELQSSRRLYQRLFMDQELKIEALNIAENPKLKEMNQAIRERSEKKNKLVLIFAELLDRKGNAAGSVLTRKLRTGAKDHTEKFSKQYLERVKTPESYVKQRRSGGHSRCESCLSRIAQNVSAADWV